jgi:hypothetical protein
MSTRSVPPSPWRRALVTGASAGIGTALARELAARGTALVLVARRADRLDTLAAELRAGGAEVETLAADLATVEGCDAVAARLAVTTSPVDLLVNNAGLGSNGPFASLPIGREIEQVRVNVEAVVRLTRAALDPMLAARRGAVLTVSSVAGHQPGPGNAVYAATKAFATSFTEALVEELRGSGVTATALLPGLTRTEFHEAADMTERMEQLPGFVWMQADAVARAALDGAAAGRAVVIPGAGNRALVWVSGALPRPVVRRVAGLAGRTIKRPAQ